MAEAFANDGAESLPAEPSTETTEAASAADATEPSAEGTPGEATPDDVSKGEPPKERWDDILNNQRTKAREEALAEWRQQYGWAEQVDRSAVEQHAQWAKLYQQDPATFFRTILTEGAANEQVAPILRSEAARILGARQQPQVDMSPDVPVIDQNGNEVTRTYSADRVNQIVQHAIQEALTKELGPLKQTVETVAGERQAALQERQAEQAATGIYQQAQTWPGFKEHEAAIAKAFAEHDDWSLQDAYISIAVPQLQAATKAQQLDELKTQAAASAVNPAAATVPASRRPKSLTDPALKWD